MTEPLSSTAGAPALRPASIRRRLAALVYEGVLLFGVVFVAGLAFSVVMQQRSGLTYHNRLSAWIAVVVGVYFVGLWHASGQTLPMKTWRLRLVGPSDTPPSLRRATIRYLAAWLWFLPPLALHPLFGVTLPHTLIAAAIWFVLWAASAAFGAARQFPHDRIAGTRVVDVPR
ncbi:MAG TPA: RDD family protein [Paraburkholderia sp.]|nr:RDD family protein [Paraburkholderia sp.]